MRQRYGITESVWASLPAERQRAWRLALLTAALLAAPLVSATGKWAVDAAIDVTAVFVAQIAVETQRRLSCLGHGLSRKRVTRFLVGTCRVSLLFLGCAFFLGIAGGLANALMRPTLLAAPSIHRFPALTVSLGLIFMATVIGRAIFKVFRDSGFERLIWQSPVVGLRVILVERRYVATSFPELILLELAAHIAILGYCMTASRLLGSLSGWTPAA